jgi:conjugative transfer signal peptidase TraF
MNVSAFIPLALAQGLLAVSASLPAVIHNPPIIINETISMAKGAYVRVGDNQSLKRGDIVAMSMNASAKTYLRDKLGYPGETLLIKRVLGISGDIFCRQGAMVTINDRTVTALRLDKQGNLLPSFSGCQVLSANQIFLLGDHPGSFDSRYFGPVTKSELSGTYRAVMTW